MNRVWRWIALLGILVAGAPIRGQDKAGLTARLERAGSESSIDDPALKPWHLKLTFQLLDKKGVPLEDGSIEEWWSAEADKRIYTSASYTATELRRGKEIYRTQGQASAPYILERMRDEVVHPLANDNEMLGVVPDLRVKTFGKVTLDCIMLDRPIKNVAFPPLGLFPTYCLNQDNDRLRISVRYASEDVSRNAIGKFQERSVPIDFVVSLQGTAVAKAHIATLSGSAQDKSFFDPDDRLSLQNGAATPLSGGVIAGRKISGDVPFYPDIDKQSHTTGTVHLHAVIGSDGHIHQLSVVDTPSPTLAISAMMAVRTWTYQPFLLNGLPCDVETTITVNYKMGPG